MLRALATAAAALALLADSPVRPRGPLGPTLVAGGTPGAPVVAVAAAAQLRAPAARTAVVVGVAAGASATENEARVASVRDALRAAAPRADTVTRVFPTIADARLAMRQSGGRIGVVVPGATAAVRQLVADTIGRFSFARIEGIENAPGDCPAARAAADASARAAALALATAGAAALGWDVGGVTTAGDRTVLGSSLDSSLLCRGGDEIVASSLDGGAVPDDRSTLRAAYALAFAARPRSSPAAPAHIAQDVEFEPGLPRWFPRDVALVVRQRSITFVGAASAPVAYAGDLVTSASRANDDALREGLRALGLTDVRTFVAGDGEPVLAVHVPRNGAVKADDVIRTIQAAGDRTRFVASTPYADCARRDAELVAAAVHDARRRAGAVAAALHVVFAAPASLLVTQPVSYTGCREYDAAVHREYVRAERFVSGAPDAMRRTALVAVTFPLLPVATLPAVTALPRQEDDPNARLGDDVTPLVRPARGDQLAVTTAARTLEAQRVDLEIADGPDAANAFREVDPAAVERAVAPWIAGAAAQRTHVILRPRTTPAEHADVTIGYRLDRVPAGFADQTRVTETVNRLGAFGYPTLQYVVRAAPCRGAADAATVDAVRRALAGGTWSAVVVGGVVVRHGACGDSFGVPAYAWWNHAVDPAVRIDVTARAYR